MYCIGKVLAKQDIPKNIIHRWKKLKLNWNEV